MYTPAVNDGEMNRLLARLNPWWRDPADATSWEQDDPDLRKVRDASFEYEPQPLQGIEPDGLYLLLGPRRIGKSVALKRKVSELLRVGVSPRRIIHCSCDRMRAADLALLEHVGRNVATARETEPRYWFLDEITAVADGWPTELKRLRNETPLGNDCVVVTGSSSTDLQTARKELAGRHGKAINPNRTLLPMSFRAFCCAVRPDLRPNVPVVRAEGFLVEGKAAAYDLQPWLNDLLALWEVFLGVGGYPDAVADYIHSQSVQPPSVDQVWNVISGELMLRSTAAAAQTQTLLEQLVLRLTQPIKYRTLGAELGVAGVTARAFVDVLVKAFIAWPLYQEKDLRPNVAALHKVYFLDPLIARLAALRGATGAPSPDPSLLTEQQLGVALLRQFEARHLGEFSDFGQLLFMKTPSRSEIDFVSGRFPKLGFEGKYVDMNTKREAQTLASQLGQGVLATRAAVDLTQPVLEVPASFIAYLLND